MFVLLPVLVMVWLTRDAFRSRWFDGWREALLFVSISAGLFAVLVVEVLSLFHIVTPFAIGMSWLTFLGGWLAWRKRLQVLMGTKKRLSVSRERVENIWLFGGIVLAIVGILFTTFCVAVTAPPNTWDAMTYHLPRVMHWLSERSVAFYPTDIPRQNNQLPGAEYLLLHIYALTGGDRLLNLLQWAALAGTAISVSLIARYFGSGLLGQALTALAAVSIPMAILQSTSCQNDLIVSFWMCTAVYFWLSGMRGNRWVDVLSGAGAAAMAFLSKGTAFVILPMFLAFCFLCVCSLGGRGLWKPAVTILIVMAVVAGWVVRYAGNLRNIESGSTIDEVLIKDYSWRCVLSNAAKHGISECTVPFKPLMQVCAKGIVALHEKIGIAIDDPRTTQGPISHMLLLGQSLHEDYAGNFFHLFLFGIFVIAAFLLGGHGVRSYAGFLVLVTFFFVVTVKWQPWISRLHLPILFMTTPLVGVLLNRRYVLTGLLVVVLCFTVIPYLLWNKSRPVFGEQNVFSVAREYQYFKNRPELLAGYEAVALEIEKSGCRVVGIKTSGDSWEYPLWALAPPGVKFCRLSGGGGHDCTPCLFVAVDQADGSWGMGNGENRAPLLSSGNVRVFSVGRTVPR